MRRELLTGHQACRRVRQERLGLGQMFHWMTAGVSP